MDVKEIFINIMGSAAYPSLGKLNVEGIHHLWDTSIFPLLERGRYDERIVDKPEEHEKFIKELFALYCYSTTHDIGTWLHNPILLNKKTPDFAINEGRAFIEIWNPNVLIDPLRPGMYEISPMTELIQKAEEKSLRYRGYPVKLLAQVLIPVWTDDYIETLEQVKLEEGHELYFYRLGEEHRIFPATE